MKDAPFKPDGGPVVVDVFCIPKRDGSYTLTLWKKDENAYLQRWEGNFVNIDDDVFHLPTPNDHDGRILEVLATVAVPPGVGPSDVGMIVSQDGVEICRDSSSIPPNSAAGMADVFIKLVAQ